MSSNGSCCGGTPCAPATSCSVWGAAIVVALVSVGSALFLDWRSEQRMADQFGGAENLANVQAYQKIQYDGLSAQVRNDPKFFEKMEAQVKQAAEGQKPAGNAQADAQKPAAAEVKKSDRPTAELFVMSHCPFGTQAEKGFLPLLEKFQDSADVKVRFVHYTMHGEKEHTEQLRQICVRDEQPAKYAAYLREFLDKSDSAAASKAAGLDSKKLESCLNKAVAANPFDTATQFPAFGPDAAASKAAGVQGSPTLVINGAKVENVGRDAKGYRDALCAAFTDGKHPALCKDDAAFPATTYGAGFGWTTDASAGSAAAAGCGN